MSDWDPTVDFAQSFVQPSSPMMDQSEQQMQELGPVAVNGWLDGLYTTVPDNPSIGILGNPQPPQQQAQQTQAPDLSQQSQSFDEASFGKNSAQSFQDWDPLSVARQMDPEAFTPGGPPLTKSQKIKLGLNDAQAIIGNLFHDQAIIDDTRLYRQGFEQAQEKLLKERRTMALASANKKIESEKWEANQERLSQLAQMRAEQNRKAVLAKLIGEDLGWIDPKNGQWYRATTDQLKSLVNEDLGGPADPTRPPLMPMPPEMKERLKLQQKLQVEMSPEAAALRKMETSEAARKAGAVTEAETNAKIKSGALVRNKSGELVTPHEKRIEEKDANKPAPQETSPAEADKLTRKSAMETVEGNMTYNGMTYEQVAAPYVVAYVNAKDPIVKKSLETAIIQIRAIRDRIAKEASTTAAGPTQL